jgi:hypothetical protein
VQGLPVFFIEENAERQREWVMTKPLQVIVELLNARFVAYRRVTIGSACRALRRIDVMLAVDMV